MSSNYESNVPEVKNALEKAIERTLEAIGIAGESWIIVLTPVGSYDDGRVGGNLRDSNGHKVDSREKEVVFYNTAEYAPYVELGTKKMDAQSYMREGIEGNINRIKNLASEMMKID